MTLFSEDFSNCSDDYDPEVDPRWCPLKERDFANMTAGVRCECGNYSMFETTASPPYTDTPDPSTTPVATNTPTSDPWTRVFTDSPTIDPSPTTPAPRCRYTAHRPAQLTGPPPPIPLVGPPLARVSKRLSLSAAVPLDCQYPGIVTLVRVRPPCCCPAAAS